MKKGDRYKGFCVREVVDVEDCDSTGVYLVHEKTGMEVFHLLNSDEENLFAFAFRTPPGDSSGVAHVLEHSVLCGSQKFPLKDPFIRLVNQSVNTYLNAYTASDHTVFPASSTVKADYFNLMAVYADAVFFPLLRPEIFMQECHRLDFDDNGKVSLQGVVYNEMKGNYSSYESVAGDAIETSVLGGTVYEYDSGGDPLEIPGLTLAKLRAFHKKYYCPANCMVFLYGNISTEEQIDFIEREVILRVASSGKKAVYKTRKNAFIKPRLHAYGPSDEKEKKSTVSCAWRIEDTGLSRSQVAMEILFLGDLLWGNDSAVVSKSMISSGLGEDLAPQTGEHISIEYPVVNFGLRGVDSKNVLKVKKTLYATLLDVCRNGVKREEMDRVRMSFEFSNREIKRFDGPYSLVLLRRCLRGWLYGEKPWETLLFMREYSALVQRMDSDPSYLSKMIHRYFLDNKRCSLVTVTPSAKWSRDRAKKERETAERQLSEMGEKKARSLLKKMHDFQDKPLSAEENDLLPRLSINDLSSTVEKIRTSEDEIEGLTLFSNTEPTNGILYFSMAVPADCLPASDYPYLPSICEWFSQVGWGSLSWDKAVSIVEGTTGGFGAYTRSATVPDFAAKSDCRKDYVGRDWVMFYFKVLEERAQDAFNLFSDCILQTDFSDTVRLRELVVAQYNSISSLVVPHANWYAAYRASCSLNHAGTVNEVWEGLSSYYTARKMNGMDINEVSSVLCSIFKRLFKGGAVLHLTGTKKGISSAKKILPGFIRKIGMKNLKKKRANPESAFRALTEIPSEFCEEGVKGPIDENIVVPGTVGYACRLIPSSPFDTRDCIADLVFAHSVSHNELWKSVRTVGGAYGVYLSTNSDSKVCRFLTYRDPRPFDSLDVLRETAEALVQKDFSEAEVEKAITGCYSDEVFPRTPASKGATAFLWELYGLNNAQKARRLKWLLSIKPGDMHKAALRFEKAVKNPGKGFKTVVVCTKEMILSKSKENTGKIIKFSV
ncbi:MAG TPA: hypothetical protein DEO40_01395 [Treponema sp.]|nr:hypothetical protein [Treponema sp.]